MALTQVSTNGVKDGSLLNADINSSAAIAVSKLANFVTNNADNRVITGSGTANTLEAESGLTFDGTHLSITDGDLVIGTSGHGIDFSATADGTGSNQAELFDDYEEGTWTPAIVSGSGSLTVHSAKYTKIGRSVFIQFYFTISGTGSNSNNAQFSGLPFTVQANGWTAAALNTGFSSAGIHCRANQASTQIDIKTTADTAITFAQLNSTWILSGIHYFTDS